MDTPLLPGAAALYDAAPCGLLVADADGRLLAANGTACRWLRHEREALVGSMRFQDLLTMGGRIFHHTHLQPLLRIQHSVTEVKLQMKDGRGTVLPTMVNMTEVAGDDRMLVHISFFIAEDRHKYEQELLLQRRRLEELADRHAQDQRDLVATRAEAEDRAQFAEQLVGVVSHDIRNPLSVIHMSTVLLERGNLDAQQRAALARVGRAVVRVRHLIGDLLDFTQARLGGGISTRASDVDLHQAVADSVAELAVAYPAAILRHERLGHESCVADADRITQALGNLVSNAVSHGDPERPITVRTESTQGGFRISVHNDGTPIPPDVLPRLFEPMVRGADAGSQGVGLGLYIVAAILRAHGGTVRAESTAQAGTTFILELPRN
ncbi:PAS domain-containing sensor histidine kinase [Ramlibacter sp. PS3R-8]|uniref:PAS domain-containing sensor histidine kinase n=1 Tax=Ramlibacter sp. PS3R-8 TaxID=3133437 RepID=UPI0030A0AE87